MFALQQVRVDNRIVPLLYRDCDYARLSWVLSSVQIIDFRQGSEHGYRTMLRLWGIGYQPG